MQRVAEHAMLDCWLRLWHSNIAAADHPCAMLELHSMQVRRCHVCKRSEVVRYKNSCAGHVTGRDKRQARHHLHLVSFLMQMAPHLLVCKKRYRRQVTLIAECESLASAASCSLQGKEINETWL